MKLKVKRILIPLYKYHDTKQYIFRLLEMLARPENKSSFFSDKYMLS